MFRAIAERRGLLDQYRSSKEFERHELTQDCYDHLNPLKVSPDRLLQYKQLSIASVDGLFVLWFVALIAATAVFMMEKWVYNEKTDVTEKTNMTLKVLLTGDANCEEDFRKLLDEWNNKQNDVRATVINF